MRKVFVFGVVLAVVAVGCFGAPVNTASTTNRLKIWNNANNSTEHSSNCLTTDTAKLSLTPLTPRTTTNNNNQNHVTLCHFRAVSDSRFGLLATPHRPMALLKDELWLSGGGGRFGNSGGYATGSCWWFGSQALVKHQDSMGWLVSSISKLPYFDLSGTFRVGVNTRPLSENQNVQWKVLFTETGEPNDAFSVREGSFTVHRQSGLNSESVINGGRPEIDSVMLQGFEKGYVGIFVRVSFVPAPGAEAVSGLNLHFQNLTDDEKPANWTITGEVRSTAIGTEGVPTTATTTTSKTTTTTTTIQPLGPRVVALVNDGSAVTQKLQGGESGDHVTVRFAVGGLEGAGGAPLQVMFEGNVVGRFEAPSGKFEYHELSVEVSKPNPTIKFINNEGGSISKCSTLVPEGWSQPTADGPCAAAAPQVAGTCSELADKNHEVATTLCESVGSRLCSVKELSEGVISSVGCGSNGLVWSRDGCAENRFKLIDFSDGTGREECSTMHKPAAVRCCADPAEEIEKLVLLSDLSLAHVPSKVDTDGIFSICDDNITLRYLPPADPKAYNKTTTEQQQQQQQEEEQQQQQQPGASGAPVESVDGPVVLFDLNESTLSSRPPAPASGPDLVDVGAECPAGENNTFVRSLVLGSEQTTYRFQKGTGFQIPSIGSLLGTGTHTRFTLTMLVKFESTDCFVRLLSNNPELDDGLYLCDGLQLTPEQSAGKRLEAMEYQHIAISTETDRTTKLYTNGRLLRSWVPTRFAWRGLQIQGDSMVLFNDCHGSCGCASEEGSGGWLASLALWNRQLDDDEIEDDYKRVMDRTGVVGTFDLTTGNLESSYDLNGIGDLEDSGSACGEPSVFSKDETLAQHTTTQTLTTPQGGGLGLSSIGTFLSDPQQFSILIKLKLTIENLELCGVLVAGPPAAAGGGLLLCEGVLLLRNVLDSSVVGPGGASLEPDVWHVVVVAVGDGGVTTYVDGIFDQTVTDPDYRFSLTNNLHFFNNGLSDCSAAPPSLPASVSSIRVWNKKLTPSEVTHATAQLGSEIKMTAVGDFSHVTKFPTHTNANTIAAPANSACDERSGEVDCVTTGTCAVGNTVGYCAKGGGYTVSLGKNFPGSHVISECRGGVVGCQRKCNEIFDCVGFSLPRCGTTGHADAPHITLNSFQSFDKTTTAIQHNNGGTFVKITETTTTVKGASVKFVKVLEGGSYVLVIGQAAGVAAGGPRVFVRDSQGDIDLEGQTEFEPSAAQSKSRRLNFVSRDSVVEVGVRFQASAKKGDVLALSEISLFSDVCEGQWGDMAIGSLLSVWTEPAVEDSSKDLYRKLPLAPLVDLSVSTDKIENSVSVPPVLNTVAPLPAVTFRDDECPTTQQHCFSLTGGVREGEVEGSVAGGAVGSAAVKSQSSCSDLGWSYYSGSWSRALAETSRVCGFSDLSNCAPTASLNFNQAKELCQAKGGRLCTVGEMENYATKGSGCGNDNRRVWTDTPCNCNEHSICSICHCDDCYLTSPGNPDNLGSLPRECLSKQSTAAARCCADDTTDPTDHRSGCSYEVGVNFNSATLSTIHFASPAQCCQTCHVTGGCVAWSHDLGQSICYLKTSKLSRSSAGGFVSGVVRAKEGEGHVIQSGLNFAGNDLFSTTLSIVDCATRCDETESCGGFVHQPSDNGCWIKTKLTLSSRSGNSNLVAGQKTNARYLRLRQLGSTVSGSSWNVERFHVFTDFKTEGMIEPSTLVGIASSGSNPGNAVDPRYTTNWRAGSSGSGEWIGVSFEKRTSYPTVRSVFVKSRNSDFPTEIAIEESDDLEVWRMVQIVREFSGDAWLDVVGLGGGYGTEFGESSLVTGGGKGLSISHLSTVIPPSDSIQTVVLRYNSGIPREASSNGRLAGGGGGSDTVIESSGLLTYANAQTAITHDTSKWQTATMSTNKISNVVRMFHGGKSTATVFPSGSPISAVGGGDSIRLFDDNSDSPVGTCLASTSAPFLISRILVFGRELSTAEAARIAQSLEPSCHNVHCNGHGNCVDGTCRCDRTFDGGWKGDSCESVACGGVPECSGNGACGSDGQCVCAGGFRGQYCENIKCPGAPECSVSGTCQDPDGTCACNSGWRGSDCTLKRCPGEQYDTEGVLIDCNNHGSCNTVTGNCQCHSDYDGSDCSRTFLATLDLSSLTPHDGVDNANGYQFIATSGTFDASGTVTGWEIYSRGTGSMKMQVWRGAGGYDYTLIGETSWSVSNTNVVLYKSASIAVQSGDIVGFSYNSGTSGIIAYRSGSRAWRWRGSSHVGVGSTAHFDSSGSRDYAIKVHWRRNVATSL